MSPSSDYLADLFGLPPEPQPSSAEAAKAAEEAEAALAAAEAELAAELAPAIESGGVAVDAPDSRTGPRVAVSWPARMRLADGRVLEPEVRNVSESGVGLVGDEHIPADAVVAFEMDVPPLGAGGPSTPVRGTIRTTYTVPHGSGVLCGGTWQGPPAGLELVSQWIERLRH